MQRFGKLVSLLILPLIVGIVYSSLKSYIYNETPIWTFEVSLFLYGSFFMLGSAYCHPKRSMWRWTCSAITFPRSGSASWPSFPRRWCSSSP